MREKRWKALKSAAAEEDSDKERAAYQRRDNPNGNLCRGEDRSRDRVANG